MRLKSTPKRTIAGRSSVDSIAPKTNMSAAPKISIGMPAYNSAATIGATIESLLVQSHGDFELIVSDNASTDSTRDVVEAYRRRDARIRYERQSFNIGINPNYSRVAQLARGEFFKWSSSSDWCAPTFLERCLAVIAAHDDTVLVAPRTRLFRDNPDSCEDYASDIEILDDRPSARLRRLTSTLTLNNAINGLIRTSALRRTRLMEAYLSADVVLLGHLALLGKFRLLNERLFYRRMEVATATALQDPAAVRRHHYPRMGPGTLFQGAKQQLGWTRVALSAPMSPGERLRSLVHVAKMCYWRRADYAQDLRGVWRYLARRSHP
jgi:glycosyltransferase involved in cell wall biosynthesis